jgi:hypothetical protein
MEAGKINNILKHGLFHKVCKSTLSAAKTFKVEYTEKVTGEGRIRQKPQTQNLQHCL